MFVKGPSVKITLAQASKMVISKSDTYIGKKKQIQTMKRHWEIYKGHTKVK